MNRYQADKLDAYRLKSAETEEERLQIMEEAITKAIEKSQMNYLLITLMVAVTLLMLLQSLSILEANPVPVTAYPWCIATMTLLIVLPWQMRKLKVLS